MGLWQLINLPAAMHVANRSVNSSLFFFIIVVLFPKDRDQLLIHIVIGFIVISVPADDLSRRINQDLDGQRLDIVHLVQVLRVG